jgi:hypothetical protein
MLAAGEVTVIIAPNLTQDACHDPSLYSRTRMQLQPPLYRNRHNLSSHIVPLILSRYSSLVVDMGRQPA